MKADLVTLNELNSSAMFIQVDYRENSSGIPELLAAYADVTLTVARLSAGDYIINGVIGVERKTATDFIRCIVSHTLFGQLGMLKKSVSRTLLIIEGNPYHAGHAIHPHVIRGVILSVMLAWQIPVIFSKSKKDTAELLLMVARQQTSASSLISGPRNYRKGKSGSEQHFFLQNIPGVGPVTADRLLDRFISLKGVVNATVEELSDLNGVGIRLAKSIHAFLNDSCREKNPD